MDNQNETPVPQFDRMIRGIVQWNTILAVALIVIGYALTRSTDLVLGIVVGAILATVNALLLARKLKKITALADPKSGQLSMMAGMLLRFLVMGAGMAVAVIFFGLDTYGIGGLLGAILLFQLVSGWYASRAMMPSGQDKP